MFLLALAACTRVAVAPDAPAPTGHDGTDSAAPPDDTRDSGTGEPAFAPATFTIDGAFAYDPGADRLIPWTEGYVSPGDTRLDFTFLDAAGAALCSARLAFASSGADAPVLARWSFVDTVDTDWGPLDAHLDHYAFVATPTAAAHDCPALDPAVWGTTDIGDLLLAHEWGVGFGHTPGDAVPDGVDPDAFGGSIAGRAVADGRPAIDAVAWATAAKLDADNVVEQDVRDQSPVLYPPEEVLDQSPPPHALYRVTASVAWDADRLRP